MFHGISNKKETLPYGGVSFLFPDVPLNMDTVIILRKGRRSRLKIVQ